MPDWPRSKKRVILVVSPGTYRAQAFHEAAERLDVDVVRALDTRTTQNTNPGTEHTINFWRPEEAVRTLVNYARTNPVDAIIAIDDSGNHIAAMASEALGLPNNSGEATRVAGNKYEMRRLFAQAGVPSPAYKHHALSENPHGLAAEADYPVVLKPLFLTGSRGVIRADNQDEFVAAFERIRKILQLPGTGPDDPSLLVEEFIPGIEVALEALLSDGQLKVLALFDKPDPLDGPYFEESIYVTPSRLPADIQEQIATCAGRAASALGLTVGPVHAELRFNERGPWMIEIAARSIGGACSKALRFDTGLSLEEVILRQALDLNIENVDRDSGSHGVMMVPIPKAGVLKAVAGIEAAESAAGIDEVQITMQIGDIVVPLPEGSMYLGFIFASGDSPEFVEAALREAHQCLDFDIQEARPIHMKVTIKPCSNTC